MLSSFDRDVVVVATSGQMRSASGQSLQSDGLHPKFRLRHSHVEISAALSVLEESFTVFSPRRYMLTTCVK